MSTATTTSLTVSTIVNVPVAKAWHIWSAPEHIIQWCSASEDWHTPRAENDLRTGGTFSSRMEARDGSFGFDFGGTYDEVLEQEKISYTLGDGRKVEILFKAVDGGTHITETFEPEGQNPLEMQQAGWQAIMDSYKKYAEANV